jgi:predicted RNA-binding protein with PIN domain
MSLIIDGYNLLNAVGITGQGRRGSSLERSRIALLNFLAEALTDREAAGTTVVFDAAGAPPGLPRVIEHGGLTVRFAAGYPDADTLIEELIRADTAPRRLTVVSSDHRLQRAARRRKARAVDSDAWYAEVAQRRARRSSTPRPPARPPLPLSESEIARWLEEFGGSKVFQDLLREQEPRADHPVDAEESGGSGPASDKLSRDEAEEIGNPFPPGYGEDLLDEPASDDDPRDPFPPGYGEDLSP